MNKARTKVALGELTGTIKKTILRCRRGTGEGNLTGEEMAGGKF